MVFNSNTQRNAASDRLSTALADLERGETAEIEEVTVPDPLGRRLADLGFLPGTRVRLVRRAPLGDPSVYELRGSNLCLRRREARGIRIRRMDPGASADTPRSSSP